MYYSTSNRYIQLDPIYQYNYIQYIYIIISNIIIYKHLHIYLFIYRFIYKNIIYIIYIGSYLYIYIETILSTMTSQDAEALSRVGPGSGHVGGVALQVSQLKQHLEI